jgi:hypothetical protein
MLTTLRSRLVPAVILAAWWNLAAAPAGARSPCAADAAPHRSQDEQKKETPADQRVSGTVVDRDGEAVEGAEVQFEGPKRATVHTNSRGHFEFSGPPGDYTLTVKLGDRSQSFERKVEGGQLKPSGTLVIEREERQR